MTEEKREDYFSIKEYLELRFNDVKEDLKKLNTDHENYSKINIENTQKIEQLVKDLSEHKNNHKWFIGIIIGIGSIISGIIVKIFK